MITDNLQKLGDVIDHESLLTRCLNKVDFAERMLKLYQDHCAEELRGLDLAFEHGDYDAVKRIAHRVAGASANAAATGMRARATELRQAVESGSLESARDQLISLHREWDKLTSAMAGICLQPSPS